MTEVEAFRTFIVIYILFENEHLSANIILNLSRALVRSVMFYACPAWEIAADTYLLKLQRLQNKVLRTVVNCPKYTVIRFLHTPFNLSYVYYYKKMCRQQAIVIQNHENENFLSIGQGEARQKIQSASERLDGFQRVTQLVRLHQIQILLLPSVSPILEVYMWNTPHSFYVSKLAHRIVDSNCYKIN
jgi:hypothetical protein